MTAHDAVPVPAAVSVKVRCVGCGHTRYALLSEFGPADVPMCRFCMMPMATVSVKVKVKP